LSCIKNSLTQVEHQIWLLRNIFWWYLLPFAIAISAFFIQVPWQMAVETNEWLPALGFAAFLLAFLVVLYFWIYRVNQRAVRTQLEPRRQELLALQASLADDASSEISGEFPMLMSASPPLYLRSPRRLIFAAVCFVAILAILWIGVPGILYIAARIDQSISSTPDEDYPKLSPFTAVRWQESQPEVELDGEWFRLFAIDGLPTDEIVAFSQKTYGPLWQKRFEEDLVELLTRMGHPPRDTVQLVVQTLSQPLDTRTLNKVPMTRANRQAIRDAAQAREPGESRRTPRSNDSSDHAHVPLSDMVSALRKEKELVGLAAMITVDGQVVASAVDGERKTGSGVPVEIGDRWHVGSITKSITATMIARLVEAGQMKWSDTVGDVFPDPSIHDDWKPVTLHQLLTHTSGAPANFSRLIIFKQPPQGPERTLARREEVLNVLAKEPGYPPGTKHQYSNVGFTIAGAMAEQTTGVAWEDLVTREVFEPLELTSAGFGPPKSPDTTLDEPRGHTSAFGWDVAVDDDTDNSPIMGPAGIVHMSLADLATYANEHLRGHLGQGQLLSPETYQRLHTPEFDDYAYGWVKLEPNAATRHAVYWHNGSNTMWYALVVFIPEKKMVVAVTSNEGDIPSAEAAAWEIVWATAKQNN
jgi:CubicO group peptidase (beta-lactamase class C family)